MIYNCRSSIKRGFTLIELLVVVAIIAILAAILLPSLAKARQRAATVACLATIRQAGLLLQTYSNEYNQKFPRQAGGHGWIGNPYEDNATSWYTVLPTNTFINLGYINSAKVVHCSARGQTQWGETTTPYIYGTALLHYLFANTPGGGVGAEFNDTFLAKINYESYPTYNFVPSAATPSAIPVLSCWYSIPDLSWGKHEHGQAANILLHDGSGYTFYSATGITGPSFQ